MSRPSLMPDDTPDYMVDAWASCMHWAIQEPTILDAFRKATGNRWQPGTTPMDRAIDDATGAGDDFVKQFILWANEFVWGKIDALDDES